MEERYYFSYTELVVNTMIDALKFEGRRVIDYKDIYSYMENSRRLLKKQEVNVVFLCNEDNYGFTNEIEDYLLAVEGKYVLLPWIEEVDLINRFRGATPFDIIKVIADKNRDSFLADRSDEDIEKYNKINDSVVLNFFDEVSTNVERIEKEFLEENRKLTKIKNYLEQRM